MYASEAQAPVGTALPWHNWQIRIASVGSRNSRQNTSINRYDEQHVASARNNARHLNALDLPSVSGLPFNVKATKHHISATRSLSWHAPRRPLTAQLLGPPAGRCHPPPGHLEMCLHLNTIQKDVAILYKGVSHNA